MSLLLSKNRKDMVAIKFQSPVQDAANLMGGEMWRKWCDGVCLCSGGGEGMT
jgi:trans-2-enoyl-CoA reductase